MPTDRDSYLMITLATPVEKIIGIGPIRAQKLKNLGIATIKQFIEWYPFRYLDLTNIVPIATLKVGQEKTIQATVTSVSVGRTLRRRMALVGAELADDSGKIAAVWYNQPFLYQKLKKGSQWVFHGQVALRPRKILQSPIVESQPTIIPIYHETEGLYSKWFQKVISSIIDQIKVPDFLPPKLINQRQLLPLNQALNYVHRPINQTQIGQARRRLSFDELLVILLKVLDNKLILAHYEAPKMEIDRTKLRSLVNSLPFQLTAAQKKAAWRIILDLSSTKPMNRLLQGDVGSGKTIVGALAALVTVHSGYQVVWLAPTEILAQQHFQSLTNILKLVSIRIGLWTGSVKDQSAKDVWVGTHALLGENTPIQNVGLVIVDEQHRFGVQQRAKLRRVKVATSQVPHFLSMTATPIPRTLALTLYGDLDITSIYELPPGRQKIITRVISPDKRQNAYAFLRSQVRQGRQIFVVTPLIEEQSTNPQKLLELERKSAIKEFKHLTTDVFPECRIGLLHGKLRPKEKQSIMDQFQKHQLDILVTTAVIEVGIDIPNATVMMIEDAERFGLAQLHQLRGRVGRGSHQSYCLLFTGQWNYPIARRMKAVERFDSGFKLAEIDLQLRGPGELAGIRQSGLPDLKMASLTDTILIEEVRRVAQNIVNEGLENYPLIQQKMAETLTERHLE